MFQTFIHSHTPVRLRAALMLSALAAPAVVATAANAAAPIRGTVEEITVIGRRLEETLPQELAVYGNRLTTITPTQIQNGGYYDVTQALQNTAPGLHITPLSGAFDYVHVSLQGSRTGEILWLVDGIRINNRLYNTTTPLDSIPANIVDHIEILEGGQGLFYGTQAAAGVINIVTKPFTQGLAGNIKMGGDTNSGQHASAYMSNSAGASSFVAYGSWDKADGFQPFRDQDFQPSSTARERGYRMLSVGGKYGLTLSDAASLSAQYTHNDGRLDFARPALYASAFNDRKEDLASVKLDYAQSNALQFFLKGYYHNWNAHYSEVDNVIGRPGQTTVTSDTEFWGYKDYGANFLTKVSPGGGLDYLLGYDYQNYKGRDEVLLIAQRTERTHAVFSQIRTTPELIDGARLAAGLRYNMPGHGDNSLIWNVSGQVDLPNSMFVRSSVGTSFRLPDASELYSFDPCCEQGNLNLKPERSTNFNGSIGGDAGAGLTWELVGYVRNVTDLIAPVTDATGTDVYQNLPDKVKVKGGEFILGAALGESVSFSGSYVINSTKRAGAQLARIPKQYVKVGVDFHPVGARFGGGADVNWVGKLYDNVSGVGRTEYGQRAIVDLNAHVDIDRAGMHRINMRLENALDKTYAAAVTRGRTDATNASYAVWFLGTPRTLHVNYAFRF